MTCAGQTTWAGFAQAIFAKAPAAKPWARITGIPSSEYPTPASRPANSVLSNQKLKAHFEVSLPSWETALDQSLRSTNFQSA
jgi:dTDP-4-dehydrorhamnose reductase